MPLVILAIAYLSCFSSLFACGTQQLSRTLTVAGFVGIAEGLPVAKLIRIEKGWAGTLGGLAIVVCFWCHLGKLIPKAAVLNRIATTLINVFGRKMLRGRLLDGLYHRRYRPVLRNRFRIVVIPRLPLREDSLEVGIPMAAGLVRNARFTAPSVLRLLPYL